MARGAEEGRGGKEERGKGKEVAGHGPAAAAAAGGWEGREERGNLTLG